MDFLVHFYVILLTYRILILFLHVKEYVMHNSIMCCIINCHAFVATLYIMDPNQCTVCVKIYCNMRRQVNKYTAQIDNDIPVQDKYVKNIYLFY